MEERITFNYGAEQHQGERDYQEDDFGISRLRRNALFVVLSDGMGGHVGGAMASNLAVKTAIDKFEPNDSDIAHLLERCVQSSNQAIADKIEDDPAFNGMGCTLVATFLDDDRLYHASVGDSPFWIYRNGELIRVNDDHSMVPVLDDLVATGRMTTEEAANDSRRNSLRSALMGDNISLLDVSKTGRKLEPNDILVLASDGLETLSLSEISETIDAFPNNMELLAKMLLDGVNAKGKSNQDNITIICIKPDFPETFVRTSEAATVSAMDDSQERVTEKVDAATVKAIEASRPRKKKGNGVFVLGLLLTIVGAALAYTFMTSVPKDEPIDKTLEERPVVEPTTVEPTPEELEAFEAAKVSNRVQELGLFVRNHPDSSLTDEADRLAWQSARDQNTLAAFQSYMRHFPDGQFAQRAAQSSEALAESAAQITGTPSPVELNTPEIKPNPFGELKDVEPTPVEENEDDGEILPEDVLKDKFADPGGEQLNPLESPDMQIETEDVLTDPNIPATGSEDDIIVEDSANPGEPLEELDGPED